jgi:hypothetical protein
MQVRHKTFGGRHDNIVSSDKIPNMNRPAQTEYDPYYERYVSLVADTDIIGTLGSQTTRLQDLLTGMFEEQGTYRYAEGKWSIKELIGHLIDGERMFAYRLFRISRGDETPIEGFEQDGYIENAHSDDRSFADLLQEFSLLRQSSMIYLKNMRPDDWSRVGTANNVKISARALVYIMAGHIEHHLAILKERYLQ